MSRDDWFLSLLLDGRLPPDEAAALRTRLESEPALAAQLDALRRLQALSETLPMARAEFSGADLRAGPPMAPSRSPRWRRVGIAAAAVALLALSHGAVYWLAQRSGRAALETSADRTRDGDVSPSGDTQWIAHSRDPIETTEAMLTKASNLDPAAPFAQLQTELVGIRERVGPLRPRLAAWAERRPPMRERARELSHALVSLEVAFEEVSDPGILSIAISSIARNSLRGSVSTRYLPANAQSVRLIKISAKRYRLELFDQTERKPRMVRDEGTLAELRERHDIQLVVQEKD